MIRIAICFLFVSQFSFSNTSSEFTGFSEISFDEYKLQKMVETEINNLFVKAEKKSFLRGTALNELINKFSNTNQISLHLTEGKVYFKSVNQPESKTVHAPLKSAKYAGEEVSIGFNAVYLKEAVSKYPNEEIVFSFKDSLSATLFLPNVDDQKTTILLMPVRINE